MNELNNMAGMLHLPQTPYRKDDKVADIDRAETMQSRKPLRERPSKAAVPLRACAMAERCDLRSRGKCDDMNCSVAAEYVAKQAVRAEVAETAEGTVQPYQRKFIAQKPPLATLKVRRAGKTAAKAFVPARACVNFGRCVLRGQGQCDDLHCSIAAEYVARQVMSAPDYDPVHN